MSAGEMIRNARRKVGITQDALAEALGVQQNQISRWETGSDTPRLGSLQSVARALGMELKIEFVEKSDA